jgi:hypothetical protein
MATASRHRAIVPWDLTLSDRDLLTHAGTISHDAALAKAQSEFDKFRAKEDAKPRPVDLNFENAIEQANQIAAAKAKQKPKKGADRSRRSCLGF